jgi:transcriptional regulator with XRE-family HTH domain
MTSLYEQACEIKKVTGWTQEQICAETGLHISTVSRIFRMPCYVGNETSHKLIKKLHEEIVKSPFPRYIEQLFNLYDDWKEHYTKKDFSRHLNILEELLKSHQAINSNELIACRIRWLLGHIYYDRAFYLKENEMITMIEGALIWYQKALNVLDNYQQKDLVVQKYKLQQCIVSTKFNSCLPSNRLNSEELRQWFLDMNYLQLVEEVVRNDTWDWVAARNGLVAASILQNFEKCVFFWKAMQKANKTFKNLDVTPSKQLVSIRNDSDLGWFVKKLTQEN